MKNLKGIFLIFFIFFSVFISFLGVNSKAFASRNIDFSIIRIIEHRNNISINAKKIQENLCNLTDNSAVMYSSGRGPQSNALPKSACGSHFNKQYKLSADNFYSKIYSNGELTGISLLLFQIQPNAP